jgi:hypothetical protein
MVILRSHLGEQAIFIAYRHLYLYSRSYHYVVTTNKYINLVTTIDEFRSPIDRRSPVYLAAMHAPMAC